jgi:hypothetical protein
MMKHATVATIAVLGLVITPTLAAAQNVSVTRSILPTEPYTLIFPEPMVAADSDVDPVTVTINHPQAPLQCDMRIVPVEDTSWTADGALTSIDDADVVAAWTDIMPGFAVESKGTTSYQDASALIYVGSSPESSMGVPLTLVHTETVAGDRGYTLDCYYATAEAANARPIVDFIIENFSTRSDAECCVGLEAVPAEPVAPAQ